MARPDRRPFGPGPYFLGARLSPDADVDETQFPFTVPAVQALEGLQFNSPITFLVGENGSGKSTIIEALARALRFDEEGGTEGPELRLKRFAKDPLGASLELTPGSHKPRRAFFLRAESFFNTARRIDSEGLESVYGGTGLHRQSHGESFLALASNRFGGEGLYVLDEPEAALSVTSALAFLGPSRCRGRRPVRDSDTRRSCSRYPARASTSSTTREPKRSPGRQPPRRV